MFIYGAVFSEDETIKALGHDCVAKFCLEKDRDIKIWDAVELYSKINHGFTATEVSTAGKSVCVIGRSYADMGMDETRSQFEKSVQEKLNGIVKNISCFMMEVDDD